MIDDDIDLDEPLEQPETPIRKHPGYVASVASSKAIAEWKAAHPLSEKKPPKGHGKKPEPRFGED